MGNALVGAGAALSVLQLVLEVVDVGEGLAQLALSIVLLGLAALQAQLQLLNLTQPQRTGSASTRKVSIMSDSTARGQHQQIRSASDSSIASGQHQHARSA